MHSTDTPSKIPLPFAANGAFNVIPTASQIGITPGAASLNDGFPPLTRTPLASGGVPPSGKDMNGVLLRISAPLRWAQAGGFYAYDNAFATDSNVGGYPAGAVLQSADGASWWRSTVDSNTSDPDAGGANWLPHGAYGQATQALSNANVTLTALQYRMPIVVLSGTLTANVNVFFPTTLQQWLVINNTSGAFSITAKTSGGTGVTLAAGANFIYGDGTNILSSNPAAGSHSSLAVIAPGSATAGVGTVAQSGWEQRPSGIHRQWAVIQMYDDIGTTSVSWTFPNSTLFANGVISVRAMNLAPMTAQGPGGSGSGGSAAPAAGVVSIGALSTTGATLWGRNTGVSGTKFWAFVEVEGY